MSKYLINHCNFHLTYYIIGLIPEKIVFFLEHKSSVRNLIIIMMVKQENTYVQTTANRQAVPAINTGCTLRMSSLRKRRINARREIMSFWSGLGPSAGGESESNKPHDSQFTVYFGFRGSVHPRMHGSSSQSKVTHWQASHQKITHNAQANFSPQWLSHRNPFPSLMASICGRQSPRVLCK